MPLTLDEQLRYCKICTNRKMDFNTGLVCSLTMAKPTFDVKCVTFNLDEPEAQRLVALEKAATEEEATTSGVFSMEQKGIKKGVLGGIAMIAIALVWFFVGLAADRIFFYPPVLFVIGIYALIKGLADGNVAGGK
ncbi:MAG TPA: hypothetical protein VK508_09410 [Cyclobacteriaceae bacterium]|nr:hypothetical protein [Cyclobacteriaceae bacterium]